MIEYLHVWEIPDAKDIQGSNFFVITKYWEQPKFPLYREQVNKLWWIQTFPVKIMGWPNTE